MKSRCAPPCPIRAALAPAPRPEKELRTRLVGAPHSNGWRRVVLARTGGVLDAVERHVNAQRRPSGPALTPAFG